MDDCTLYATSQSTAVAMLRYYTREASQVPYVSLKKCGITNISELLSAFTQLPNMLSLDLSDNNIISLPQGTDLAACMPQLRSLDLSNNPLELSESVLITLQHLRELRVLRLSLPSNSRVNVWIAESLPQLQILNGVKVHRSNVVKGNLVTLPNIKMERYVCSEETPCDDGNSKRMILQNPSVIKEKNLILNTLKLIDYSTKLHKPSEETSTTTTREVSFLQQTEHPQLSLLSVLRIIQRMAWSKQRREEERRRQNLLYTQSEKSYPYHYYYETMIQYMFVFFGEQYSTSSDAEIVEHIMGFIRSLHYYVEVEKCIEAYVFLQILHNRIEESYWLFFESLSSMMSDLLEHIVSSDSLDLNLTVLQSDINREDKQNNSWIHHCAHHGFLSKEHVFRIVDALIPLSQRDSLLHIDLVEAVVNLLSVSDNNNNNNNDNNNIRLEGLQSTTVTAGCLLRCLCEVFVKHHERSIQPIVEAFYTIIDSSSNEEDSIGIINMAQLRDLLQCMGSPLAASSEFFMRVHISTNGPLEDAPITFSAVVEAVRYFVRGSPSFSE
ncbi:uncharacterized protein TM35_000072880 [Trypanosoma theileri]|uniref:Leucine-rich repeat protein n=1 Tax=Trypanosoma theileri TaxID=67003 RepID=A0A1X0P1N5_9TRYP|nr:uncharacterized protein TM35_000072880 [Trypanosoma theileri]ORC90864.1 hypothetical protein TM35_000072880 [Trypanosoma theileri]